MDTTRELSAIGKTIQDYFDGMHLGDTKLLRMAFHPHAYLFGYYQGPFSRFSLEEWMEEVESTPKPAESGEAFDMRIVSTDVTGRVAMTKVVVLYEGLRFTDYLTLIKFEDDWKIINKAYHHE
ncbi:nuclear transport factor 2 family protein [Paraburkholderia rhynchosiae]|uniref:Nuclear transport factor 2 family protein n=1 Tax=Paraburkholderia rhynchosiae TaxID=487049 RepID=A0A2N7VNJ4_9BURK|nr:nuclear transport factor 2 family protein [Paraburkholderia rhynchosiae]PMS18710.1 nuclear transport factor 2 family protein [Paraburkholderia rhynchosiae]CAB3743594.1 hypothetical protein LMG27174_07015 [Paraburkholderia rhynchosiae]